MMQAKEKAPRTAATMQSATQENKVHNHSTADQAVCQVDLREKIETAADDMRGIADLLNAVSIASEYGSGYESGIYFLSRIAYRLADGLKE